MVHLCVLVNEHECIWHIVVTKMDDRGADPGANLFLASVKDGVHGL